MPHRDRGGQCLAMRATPMTRAETPVMRRRVQSRKRVDVTCRGVPSCGYEDREGPKAEESFDDEAEESGCWREEVHGAEVRPARGFRSAHRGVHRQAARASAFHS